MMNDDKTKLGITDMTKITMTLGQELVIMDELREIKIRGVIEAITCKENIETSMLTGD
jgi:hypothetical protein